MAKQKKPVHRVEMTEGKRNIIRQLLEEYDIETAEDIQDALKDLLGGTWIYRCAESACPVFWKSPVRV